MTKARFKEHFSTGPVGVIITRPNGRTFRADGKPLTASDRKTVANNSPQVKSSKV
jgi:hypothetical protein